MSEITLKQLQDYKQDNIKFASLTAYDASFARLLCSAGVEVILIGDSLGNVIQGHSTTVPVTMADMIYHTNCVARGNQQAFLIADMPFMSYATKEQALTNAALLIQAGAHAVKLEGGEWLVDTITALTERGIVVCAHIGLQPQSVHKDSGYRMHGKEINEAKRIHADAIALEKAGAALIVLECMPVELAKRITQELQIPTIGIGAGPFTDAQIAVLYDILGISINKIPAFAQEFITQNEFCSIEQKIKNFVIAVKEGPHGTLFNKGILKGIK